MSDENAPLDEGDGIKNLRKQYDETAKELKAAREELAKFQAEKRAVSVAEVFKAKNLPEKAATLYQGEDTSPEAVSKWIEEYGDVFGVQAQTQAPANDPNAQAAQRVSQQSHGTVDSIQNGPVDTAVLGNPEEILRAIQTLPMDELVKLGYMPSDGTLFNPHKR
jgi:hypothetical protein